jgi:hypothetical protein
MIRLGKTCVLLFSGGRDSTIAAVKLSAVMERLILVTVTSGHLAGMDAVHQRVLELKKWLQGNTKWVHVFSASIAQTAQRFSAPTCLPCNCLYTAIGLSVAENNKADSIAFGYTRYQAVWPEQTDYAIERLTSIVQSRGFSLVLPVHDIESKREAEDQLNRYSLSTNSLEQKCSKSALNVELDQKRLKEEIAVWEQALLEILSSGSETEGRIVTDFLLSDLNY